MQERRREAQKTRKYWYDQKPEGTEEELKEAFDMTSEYLYKILDYAVSNKSLTKEELDKERRIYAFARQGPKAGYFVHNPRGKLTSADVLFILSSYDPSIKVAKLYDMAPCKINEIRRGESLEWKWEYTFYTRMKKIIKEGLAKFQPELLRKKIYKLSKVYSPANAEILIYTTSHKSAKKIRDSIIKKGEMAKLLKDGTLDIIYPIEKIEVVR
jgi:hypothetical protein